MYSYPYYAYTSLLLDMLGFIGFLAIAMLVLILVSLWKIFTKAGEPGWKCLIPIYGSYVQCSFSWEGQYYWIYLAAEVVLYLLSAITGRGVSAMFSTLASLAGVVYFLIMNIKMAQAFNRSIGFGVGLALLPIVFYPILAFGSSTYGTVSSNRYDPDFGSSDDYGSGMDDDF